MTGRFRYALGVSLVVLSFIGLLGLSPSQPSDQVVRRSAIAFTSTRHDPTADPWTASEIYLLTRNPNVPNDWTPRRLTWDNTSAEAFAALSPHGTKIAFDSNRLRTTTEPVNTSDLFVMDTDGGESTLKHVIRGSSASWGPGGQNIAYHASASGTGLPITGFPGSATGDSDIFVANVNGVVNGMARPRNLLANHPDHIGAAAIDDDPDWHPTRPKIVFTSHYPGEPNHDRAFSAELYMINADGTDLTRLTFNSDPTKPSAGQPTGAEEERSPTWHPNGTRILYACRTKPLSGPPPSFQLCVMNADGTGQTRLTNTGRQYLGPSWSPDGSEIVFHRAKSPGVYELWKINADGTGEAQLTSTPGSNGFAHWGEVELRGAAAR